MGGKCGPFEIIFLPDPTTATLENRTADTVNTTNIWILDFICFLLRKFLMTKVPGSFIQAGIERP